jgi:hypothetical protein
MPKYTQQSFSPSPQSCKKPGVQNQYYTKYDSQLTEAYVQQQILKKINQ